MTGMTADSPPAAVAVAEGLATLAPRFDVVLCDVWGVLHNGVTAFAAAADALTRFRQGGGRVVLITNAPRPHDAVLRQLDGLKVPRQAYDAVVTSGDLTRAAVMARPGQRVHHLGPERDRPIFDGLDPAFSAVEAADYVVCSGFFDDEADTVEDYRPTLARMRERGLLMICANPDLVVERGNRLVPCAGALAAAYEAIGGQAYYAGKPHRPIYEEALRRAGTGEAVARERVLAVGDAIRTDIAGAAGFGIASLLVARGIHAAELDLDDGSLAGAPAQAWLARQAARPDAVMERLVWR